MDSRVRQAAETRAFELVNTIETMQSEWAKERADLEHALSVSRKYDGIRRWQVVR